MLIVKWDEKSRTDLSYQMAWLGGDNDPVGSAGRIVTSCFLILSEEGNPEHDTVS